MAPAANASFEVLFKTHFKGLSAYAYTFLKEEAMAEEIVQQVFCRIWEKQEDLRIHTSLKAYLYKSVYHECLNYLKHRKVMAQYASYAVRNQSVPVENASGKVLEGELKERIREAMNTLPEQCRTIFQLSRYEGLKYQQIADHLGLSVKTIENQMGKALKIMRAKLVEYLPLFVILLSLLYKHTSI